MSIVGSNPDAVVGGVDTHVDVHVAAAVNHHAGHSGGDRHSRPLADVGHLFGRH
jgi:hypothetical protein